MKYYIRFGKIRKMLLAGNSYNACIQVFQKYLSGDPQTSLLTAFIVSQRGFEDHEDDEIIGVGEIINLLRLSNKAAGEIRKKNL